MITRVVFDLGGVVFNWQPRQVLRQLLPHRIHSEAQAGHWAGEIFQSFHPDCDWARFDLGLIEDEDTVAAFVAACAALRHWSREGLA